MNCDFLVIGAGIAGASAAFHLAAERNGGVVLLEREEAPGYHTTGRSAGVFTNIYGHGPVPALIAASRPFLEQPPDGFTDHALLSPRGELHIGRDDQQGAVEDLYAKFHQWTPDLRLLTGTEAEALHPALAPGYTTVAAYEPRARDIDVHALHQGFLRGFRARGGTLVTDADVRDLEYRGGAWHVETKAGTFTAGTVVNAAGAWADAIAGLASLEPLGLTPKRRTVIIFDPPAGMTVDAWPMTCDVGEEFYFKPDAGRVLASPEDETPSPPCDAQPEDLDVAIVVDRIERATVLKVERIGHKRAGLRSFFADRLPAVGPDPRCDGFVWLAGQGGYGIMTSPALGRLAAALALGTGVPEDMAALGVTEEALAPARLLTGAKA